MQANKNRNNNQDYGNILRSVSLQDINTCFYFQNHLKIETCSTFSVP